MTEINELLGEGIKALQKGNSEEAINSLTEFLEINPKDDFVWYLLGEAYLLQGDCPRAQVSFIKSAELCPEKSARSWIRLGNIYMQDQEVEEAIKVYSKATENEPDNFDAWQHLGLVHVYTDKEKAIEILLKALALNPDDVLTLSSIGTLYDIQKNHEKAIEYCERALEIDPEDVQTMRILGSAYFRKGECEKGIKIIRKTLEIDQSFVEGMLTLGAFLNQIGEKEEAEQIMKKAALLRGI